MPIFTIRFAKIVLGTGDGPRRQDAELRDAGSGAIGKEFYCQNFSVGVEVGIRRKSLPPAPHSNSTDQEIDAAAGNAAGTAAIRAFRGLLIIPGRDRFIGKSPDLFKLKPLTDSGE